MRRRGFVLGSTTAALMAFMYLPLLVVVLFAFNAGANLSWPPQGLSLRWFRLIFGEDAFVSGLLTSVRAAAFTAAVAGIVGTTAAFAFVRRPSRFMRWLETGSRLPVMLPPLFMGIALAVAMKTFSIDPSLLTITAGHVVATTPFVILIVAARLRNYDVAIEQAAHELGCVPADGAATNNSALDRALGDWGDGHRGCHLLRRGSHNHLHLGHPTDPAALRSVASA